MNQNMWQLFIDGLVQTGILGVDPMTFAAASGLAIADWEITNYTGIGPTKGLGSPIPSKVFVWADPMPDTTRFYQPRSSLSDSYATFLDSLSVAAKDSSTIAQARTRVSQFQMTDGLGDTWPGYGITPGLNDWFIASLQSVELSKPPQIDFSVPSGASAARPQIDASAAAARFAPWAEFPLDTHGTTSPQPEGAPFFGIDGGPMEALRPAAVASSVQRVNLVGSWLTAVGGSRAATIRFQAQAAQMFSIQPSRWFSETIVRTFCDRIDPTSALGGKVIFGPGGFLNARASQILVAFKRVVTVNGPSSVIDSIQSSVEGATGSFNIGSFYFPSDPSGTSVKQTAPETIIFQDNTNAPAVIGIAVQAFGT